MQLNWYDAGAARRSRFSHAIAEHTFQKAGSLVLSNEAGRGYSVEHTSRQVKVGGQPFNSLRRPAAVLLREIVGKRACGRYIELDAANAIAHCPQPYEASGVEAKPFNPAGLSTRSCNTLSTSRWGLCACARAESECLKIMNKCGTSRSQKIELETKTNIG